MDAYVPCFTLWSPETEPGIGEIPSLLLLSAAWLYGSKLSLSQLAQVSTAKIQLADLESGGKERR